MTIPKRPEHKPVKVRDDLWSYKYQNGGLHSNKIVCMWWHEKDMSRHERAVAKRAVEALRRCLSKLDETRERGSPFESTLTEQDAREALAEIEASGWKP